MTILRRFWLYIKLRSFGGNVTTGSNAHFVDNFQLRGNGYIMSKFPVMRPSFFRLLPSGKRSLQATNSPSSPARFSGSSAVST
ncbi:hypothetical protein BaRGS_00034151 [Batillaria attramentaria]|uniref:Uncharacterized protein n=1 Tax=Batillaria attramentaria TaxID=370345 RepID=A0ABD0JHZ2_9CAEN